jgi:hypothetical protein
VTMIIGFTASRKPNLLVYSAYMTFIEHTIESLEADAFVSGACVGGDEIVALMVARYHPTKQNIVIVPANLSQVSQNAIDVATEVIRMPRGTSYRERNTEIVLRADRMIAFWNGQQRSGTLMTINIARRAGKIQEADIFPV